MNMEVFIKKNCTCCRGDLWNQEDDYSLNLAKVEVNPTMQCPTKGLSGLVTELQNPGLSEWR